jgi:hypothetical protein
MQSLAFATDSTADSISARTFFSTLFSMDDNSPRTSDSNVSICVSRVTGFVELLFAFISPSCLVKVVTDWLAGIIYIRIWNQFYCVRYGCGADLLAKMAGE